MTEIAKSDNLSIDDLAKLWNIDKADIAKAMGLDVSAITDELSDRLPTTSELRETKNISVTTMDANHAIVVYQDYTDNNKGKAVCLTLSGTTITAESPTIFNSGNTNYTSVTAMGSTQAIVTYSDYDDVWKGKAVCLTLSGTTITAGTEIIFESGETRYISVTTMNTTRAIVVYQDHDDDKSKAVCLTLSGTTITAGTPTTFNLEETKFYSVTSMDSTHAIVTYSDDDDSDKGKAVCLTLSGTSITAEASITFNSGHTNDISITSMDSTHAIVTYSDGDDNDKGKAVCLILSGTLITAEAPITFNSGHTDDISITTMDSTHAIVAYQENEDHQIVCLTLSDTTIIAESPKTFKSGSTKNISITKMDANHAIVVHNRWAICIKFVPESSPNP